MPKYYDFMVCGYYYTTHLIVSSRQCMSMPVIVPLNITYHYNYTITIKRAIPIPKQNAPNLPPKLKD